MDITILGIEIDTYSLLPALTIRVDIQYYADIEMPLSITGRLNTSDNKTVSFLNEYNNSEEMNFDLKFLSKQAKETAFKSGNKEIRNYFAVLTAPLTSQAIEHIERLRELHPEKLVALYVNFVIKHMRISMSLDDFSAGYYSQVPLLKLTSKTFAKNFTIKQGDWVKQYSPSLGLGNFVLLEFSIPNKHTVSKEWEELYNRLYLRTQEMEQAIRQGDWQKTMFAARQFYENIKVGDKKPNHKWFADNLQQLFKDDQHGEEGFNNFLNGIYQFFEFTSKYIHDKDKQLNVVPVPITTKEDAYFAFTLCVGLLNIVGKKISK